MTTIRTDDRLRALINQLVAFVAVLDADGNLKAVDDEALHIAGLRLGDVWGKPFWDTYWWTYDDAMRDRMRGFVETARKGGAVRQEIVARTVNDGRLPVLFHIGPILDETGTVVEIVASGSDISMQKMHEAALDDERERLELLNRELRHRVRNLFAIVQAGLSISARTTDSKEAMLADARGRIASLAASHMAGVEARPPQRFTLDGLARAVLAPHDPGDGALRIDGPAIDLPERAITPLTLILHELATNAARSGTWSRQDGTVHLRWAQSMADLDTTPAPLEISWSETASGSEELDSAQIKELSFSKGLVERCAGQLRGSVSWNDLPEGWQASLLVDVEGT